MISFIVPEEELPYNPHDIDSVLAYAKKLEGSTLTEAIKKNSFLSNSVRETSTLAKKHKGRLGQLTESLYFLIKTNSSPEPDFPSINLELKTSGLLPASTRDRHKNISGKWKAKEALPLGGCNYNKIVCEEFLSSSFLKKNRNLLIIFYEYHKNVGDLNKQIKLTGLLAYDDMSEHDKAIIENDWNKMRQGTLEGKAHEFSRGDFDYLELATSGTSSTYTTQPFGPKTRTRKYCLKSGFMHSFVSQLSSDKDDSISLFEDEDKDITLSEKISQRFAPYIGKTVKAIASDLSMPSSECKQKFSRISRNILKAIFEVPEERDVQVYVEEFAKAEISIKTVRLDDRDMPCENLSFPAFKFKDIVREDWESSTFRKLLDRKFLFIFFKEKGDGWILDSTRYWNMPNDDIREAKKVWGKTKDTINAGKIVREIAGRRRLSHFPKLRENPVAHVRPHAQTTDDTYELPTKDVLTGSSEYTKHCFWLNKAYIKDNIYQGR
tara:strand:+ start:2470 stop:3948 length:1479 start_codon:yes stop_codon:yes gene_type:complete